jgi:hypothetical protein
MAALRWRGRVGHGRFPPALSGAFVADPPPLRPVVKLERTVLLRARVRGSAWENAPTPLAFGFPPSDVIQQRAIRADRSAARAARQVWLIEFDGEGSEAAGRYARAVFDLAKDAKQLDVVEQDFAKFVAAWRESAELRDVARSPLIDPVEKAKALVAVAAKPVFPILAEKPLAPSRRIAAPPSCRRSPPPIAPRSLASAALAKSKSSSPAAG